MPKKDNGSESIDPNAGEIEEAGTIIPSGALIERLVSRLPQGRLQVRHLARMVTPMRGSTWELPTLEGPQPIGRSLVGVVLGATINRAYWAEEMGTGNPAPDCVSPNGVQGYGDPGIRCMVCPNAEWGSGKNRGQACREFRSLLVYPAERRQMLPTVVRISPASIEAWDRYSTMLIGEGLMPEEVVTSFDLVDATSRGGIEYAGVAFRMLDRLSAVEAMDASHLWDVLYHAIGGSRLLADAIETTSMPAEPLPEEVYAGLSP